MTRPVPSDLEPFERDAFALGSTQTCPAPELLMPAVEGTLPDPLRGRVLSHLQHCNTCRSLADALASADTQPTVEESDRILARIASSKRSTRGWYRPLAAAAVFVIVAGGAWLTQFDRQGPVMPAPPVAPATAAKVAAPVFVLALEKPAIELPPGALVVRSAASDPYAAALSTALEPFRRDDYQHAIQQLTALRASHAEEPFVNYYLGVSYLMAGRASEAVGPLERARTDGTGATWLRVEASWYLAVALERAGRRDAAAGVLTEICGTGDARRQEACGALGSLLVPRIGWRGTGGKGASALLADADFPNRRPWRGVRRPVC